MSEKLAQVTAAIFEAMDITDGLNPEAAERYARVAIEAMRVPTRAMCEAGKMRWHEPMYPGDISRLYLEGGSALVWDRAIDAALKE